MSVNWIGIRSIFLKEIGRSKDVAIQAFVSPVLSTVLYFLVFGTAIGNRLPDHFGVPYSAFIVPGLILMALLMNSLMAASSGIYFPRFIGTMSDLLSAPLSLFEITCGFALAAAARAIAIGATIFLVASLLTTVPVVHPVLALILSVLITFSFATLGLILGIWAKDFEQLSLVPTLILTPLSFLGGIFYSIEMLPSAWRTPTLLNPVYYLVDGLRFSFFGVSDTNPWLSFGVAFAFLAFCLFFLSLLLRKGYGMRQ